MQNVSSPAYLYWWAWAPIVDGSHKYGAFHAAEVPFVFGDLSGFNMTSRPEDELFSDLMMTIWTNFAKTGDPSVEGVLDWPAYDSERATTAVLGKDITLESGIRSERVEKITAAYAAQRNK